MEPNVKWKTGNESGSDHTSFWLAKFFDNQLACRRERQAQIVCSCCSTKEYHGVYYVKYFPSEGEKGLQS